MTRIARRILVTGRVQGVGFRESAVRAAERLGVTGWVRNLDDGRVEAHAEGDAAAVEALVDHCRVGPSAAVVTDVAVVDTDPEGATAFSVRRDA